MDEEDGQYPMTKQDIIKLKGCNKCGTEDTSIVLNQIHSYCSDCFINTANHKFRSFLGKNKFIRSGERVIISFSGGLASTCMLQMVKESQAVTNPKKMPYNPIILFIDEGICKPSDIRQQRCRKVFHAVSRFGFPLYITTLEQAVFGNFTTFTEVKTEEDIAHMFQPECVLGDKIMSIISSAKTNTAKESLVRNFRIRALIEASRKLNIRNVFLGDNMSVIAVRILADVAQGRGSQLANSVGLLDIRCNDVGLLRPMREFSTVELTHFGAFYNLTICSDEDYSYWISDCTSIDQLTAKFISGLQATFPSTESTIFRTGDKLCPLKSPAEKNPQRNLDGHCDLCWSCVTIEDVSANATSNISPCTQNEDLLPITSPKKEMKKLCYGCKLVAQDMDCPSLLDMLLHQESQTGNV